MVVFILQVFALIAVSRAQIPLLQSITGQEFMEEFYFFTDRDPANGVVTYVSESTARSDGLVSWTGDTFTMKADSTHNSDMGKGRNSVRLVSHNEFGDGVYIFDVNHMPVGCGTWPAAWTTTTQNWPYGGEIDVIEGANANSNTSIATLQNLGLITNESVLASAGSTPDSTTYSGLNVVSLHTAPSCPVADRPTGVMSGSPGSTECSGFANGNVGCGVIVPGKSFGGSFNENGGGIYAMYRDIQNSSTIQAWFWPRDVTPPLDVANTSSTSVNPTNWGTPTASFTFQSPSCGDQFHRHAIVLNIDFCGDYAEATYSASGCPGNCEAFVKYNPQAFTEAFFEFRSVRVYSSSAIHSIVGSTLTGLSLLAMLSIYLIYLG